MADQLCLVRDTPHPPHRWAPLVADPIHERVFHLGLAALDCPGVPAHPEGDPRMTNLVPADQIEQHVGARRHQLAHLGRANSTEQTVYILHSHACRDSGIDLRACIYSRALDRGIDLYYWAGREDQVVTLQVVHGMLLPDVDGATDIVLVDQHLGRGAE